MNTAEAIPADSTEIEAGSFRDRCGRIYYRDNGVYRALSGEASGTWGRLRECEFFRNALRNGAIVGTEETSDLDAASLSTHNEWHSVLCHERIPFISYPYEWSFSMLKDSSLLQLELLEAALAEDMILKDATPYNVQWRGAQPTFIDVLSFEPLNPGDVWVGYRQFCQLCLYPLMLQAFRHVPFQALLRGELEGISPEDFWKMLSFRDVFRSGVLKHVFLHSRLQQNFGDTGRDIKTSLANAGFHKEMILANIRSLKRLVQKLGIPEIRTEWADYADTCVSYSRENFEAKYAWIEDTLSRAPRRKLVWDLGCNTGTFSRLAARHADYVVGMDIDHMAIERFYLALRDEGSRNILPLVSNIANASPALGWRGKERKRLEDRGRPSLIMALALIHHVVITANVPIHEFVESLSCQGDSLIIEFVTRDDPMVQKLIRNKVDQYSEYSTENFEHCLSEHFNVERREVSPSGTRILYYGIKS